MFIHNTGVNKHHEKIGSVSYQLQLIAKAYKGNSSCKAYEL